MEHFFACRHIIGLSSVSENKLCIANAMLGGTTGLADQLNYGDRCYVEQKFFCIIIIVISVYKLSSVTAVFLPRDTWWIKITAQVF